MECEHKKIKSVNCELFCMFCGEKLPADFLTAKAEKPTVNTPADDSKGKSAAKKRQPKKAE